MSRLFLSSSSFVLLSTKFSIFDCKLSIISVFMFEAVVFISARVFSSVVPSIVSNLSILELFDFFITLRTLLNLSNDGYFARQFLHDQIKFSSSPFFIHDHNVVLMLAHCKQKFSLQPEQITLS